MGEVSSKEEAIQMISTHFKLGKDTPFYFNKRLEESDLVRITFGDKSEICWAYPD